MKLSVLFLVGGIVTSSFAHPAPPTHVVHEKRNAQLDKWRKRDAKLNRDAVIPLSIGLTQRNLGKFTLTVSFPCSIGLFCIFVPCARHKISHTVSDTLCR